ncbi:CHAT domain-containing protein [Microbacterium album]|uniref:CHAT domain-containing protein n=1 Tax=Microbacterium album TaxID=2053191 RepID=A0A917IFW7_9MICO|nr:CHAT domain-containing protein [Microbacterium album]GGH49006.1 CHAT domain-containing protein [Microbacterium album]
MLSAEALHARAVELCNRGRLAAARKVLRVAGERATSAESRARIAGTLAYVMTRTGHPEEAERTCREALELRGEDERLSLGTVAVLHGQLGTLAVERGDFVGALGWLDQAISVETDRERLGGMLTTRSVALMRLDRLREARTDLDTAAEHFAAVGKDLDRAFTVHNVGYVALLEGDLVTALEKMAEARPLVATSPVNAAICDVDRAEVLREAGQVAEAERTLAAAARSFGAAHMPQSRAEAEFHLARSLLTHDRKRAADVAEAARRRFRALGSAVWAARAEAVRLRALLGQGSDAGHRAPSAVRVDEVVGQLMDAGLRDEARALRLTERIARARAGDLAHWGARLRDRDPLSVRLLVYEARAVRAAARGRDAEARRSAAAGLESLAAWQRSFGSLDMLSSVAMHGTGLMFEGIAAAVRTRRPDVIFEWSERARHFAHQVVPVRPPRDPQHAADLAQLRLLRDELGDEGDGDERVAVIRERVRERVWATAGGDEGIPRVGLEELRAGLDRETALVTFLYQNGSLTCLAVPGDGSPAIFDVPWEEVRPQLSGLRADLDVSAAVRTGPMSRVVRSALERRLSLLSRLLVEPALAAAGDPRRVLLTAPGILAGLPWGMLPAMRGRSVTLARSASRWLLSRGACVTPHSAGFAVGPAVARGREEAESGMAAWQAARDRARPAERAQRPPPRLLQEGQARVDAVRALAEQVDVLHVIAHGRHASNSPMMSGLSLADGALFGYDIDLVERTPRTVVLSACELGRSSVRWGAEAIGMAHTWLHAGAVCVIAAPVIVADDVAAELLGAFHGGLAAGLAPADALARASGETGHVAPFLSHGSGF